MDKYTPTAGLNFVPLLTQQQTPPPSSRSCKSSISKRDYEPMVYYNGNYEGDVSMFKSESCGRLLNLNLINRADCRDTESEGDGYKKALDLYNKSSAALDKADEEEEEDTTPRTKTLLSHVFSPDLIVKMETNPLLKRAVHCWQLLHALSIWLLNMLIYMITRLDNSAYVVLRGRTIMRNFARRVLWWMTLAKCGDFLLFSLILLCIPLLLITAICGFILSLYCILKDNLCRASIWVRNYLGGIKNK